MGSVSDGYQCPGCGRKGMGVGYCVEAMSFPIVFRRQKCPCVNTSAHKYSKQSEYFTEALLLRFGKKQEKLAQPIHKVPDCAWKVIAGFLADRG